MGGHLLVVDAVRLGVRSVPNVFGFEQWTADVLQGVNPRGHLVDNQGTHGNPFPVGADGLGLYPYGRVDGLSHPKHGDFSPHPIFGWSIARYGADLGFGHGPRCRQSRPTHAGFGISTFGALFTAGAPSLAYGFGWLGMVGGLAVCGGDVSPFGHDFGLGDLVVSLSLEGLKPKKLSLNFQ